MDEDSLESDAFCYDDIDFQMPGLSGDAFENFIQREVLDRAMEKVNIGKNRISQSILKRKENIEKQIKAPPFLRTVDKISFCLGVAYIIIMELFLLKLPQYMNYWYIYTMIPLLFLRFVTYHKAKFHYFMLDFCYFSQLLLLFYLVFYPNSRLLFQLVFAFSNGPLSWGIVAWTNSLVFHDLDKMTSLLIHYVPCMVTYSLRWFPLDGDLKGVCSTPDCPISWFESVVSPILFYLFWQVSYILKTEFIDKKKLDANPEVMTSLRWMTVRRPHPIYQAVKKNQNSMFCGNFFINYPSILLMSIQLLYTILTVIPTGFMYTSFTFHTIMVIFFAAVGVWNGANFYFEVFTKSYSKRIGNIILEATNSQKIDTTATSA